MKVVSLGGVCLRDEDIAALQARDIELVTHDETPCDAQEIIKRAGDADIIISFLCELDKSIIDAIPNLKMISLATTGCDGIDLEAATARSIAVTYTPGYATEAVAEHTIGLMLAAGRLTQRAADDFKGGLYDHCRYVGKQLQGNKLGIIGYGRIGQRVAEIATKGFGMQVRYSDRDTQRSELEDILCTSDFISLHVTLTPQTKHLLGPKEFMCMQEGVVIVNTARGGIIDEAALLENLESGKVFAAGLDVLEKEPMDPKNPLVAHPNTIVTPHIAYHADVSIENRSQIVTENILKFLDGKAQNLAC